jgi:hypothetical protein
LLLNLSKILDKMEPFFGGSTLCPLKAAKHLLSTLGCQQCHSFHAYFPYGQKEEQQIAASAGKESFNVLHYLVGVCLAGTSGAPDLRVPFKSDHFTNAYAKDKHRADEAKHRRRDTKRPHRVYRVIRR